MREFWIVFAACVAAEAVAGLVRWLLSPGDRCPDCGEPWGEHYLDEYEECLYEEEHRNGVL